MEYTPEGRSVERSILQGASSGAERSILHKMPERSEFRSAPAFLQFLAIQNFSAPFGGRKVPTKIFFSLPEQSERSGTPLRGSERSGVYSGKKYSPERGAEYTPVAGARSGANSGKIRSVQSLVCTALLLFGIQIDVAQFFLEYFYHCHN